MSGWVFFVIPVLPDTPVDLATSDATGFLRLGNAFCYL